MKSTLIFANKKELHFSLRMEEVYLNIESGINAVAANAVPFPYKSKSSQRKKGNYLDNSLDYGWWNIRNDYQELFGEIERLSEQYSDYTWYFDFDDISSMHPNASTILCTSTKDIQNKYLVNCEELSSEVIAKLETKGFKIMADKDHYAGKFRDYLMQHISDNCLSENPVSCPCGEIISHYINLTRTLEDSSMLFKICFLLSRNIDKRLSQEDRAEYSLFCHSLNGACIAENISVILGMDVVYADRLNATGNVRKLFMPDHFEQASKCIVVTDLICQGHEIHRAKDIAMMLGGEIKLVVGAIDIGFIKEDEKINSNNFISIK